MHIEMDGRLAKTILEVQEVCNQNQLDIMDLPCGAMWMELVGIALSKVTEVPHYHPQQFRRIPMFNVIGCQSSRVCGTGEPNTTEIVKPVDNPRKV